MATFNPATFNPATFNTGGVSPPDTGDTCVLYAMLVDSHAAPLVGALGSLVVISLPEELDSGYISGDVLFAVSDDNGRIEFDGVAQGAKVLVRINAVGLLKEVEVLDQDEQQI